MIFTPFFINSNLITNETSLRDYSSFMEAVAGNTGNSYITWALLKELGIKELKDEFHIQNIYNFDFSKSEKVSDFVNQNCSHVILILQDQIRIHESYGYKLPYEGIKNLLEKISLPVIVAGLGANSFTGFDPDFHNQLPKDLVEFLHYLSRRCNELGVRGNFTAEVLGKLGIKNVIPVGCPSFFESGPKRIITKKQKLSDEKIFFTSNFANPLNELNFQVCQDHQEREIIKMIAFDELGDSYKSEVLMQKYAGKRYRIFSSIPEWKDFASKFDFAVGYRVHGSILAINSGCVALCCNGDSRAKEMCELLCIPHNGSFNPDSNLFEAYESIDIEKMNSIYPALYENFASFIKRNCGVKIGCIDAQGKEGVSQPQYKSQGEVLAYANFKLFSDFKKEQATSERKINELSELVQELQENVQATDYKLSLFADKLNSLSGQISQFDIISKDYKRIRSNRMAKLLKKILRL